MNSQPSRFLSRRVTLAAAAIGVVVLAAAAIAMASKPVKGATYSGEIQERQGGSVVSTFSISFKVSSSGKKAGHFSLLQNYPVYCQGGGFGTPKSKSAKISSKGKFKAKLPLIFAPTHQNQGNLIITGKFGRHGHEKGKVTTAFKSGTFHNCNGTAKYKTTTG